jgi:4-hydroxy-tetrahydrodipicolinate synthase
MMKVFDPVGVMPACLLPLTESGEIDQAAYRRHLRDLAGIAGLTGIVVNGHAAEVHALTHDQQVGGIEAAVAEVGDQIPVIAGIYAEGTGIACDMAKAAARAGAHALLIFPPNSLMFGGNGRPELGAQYVRDVAGATSLPVVLFQYPLSTALSYSFETLVSLCEEVENIVAIKDLGSEPRVHERTIAALHGLSRPVNVLTSQSQWLGASLAMGAKGIISGAGSVIADRQRALFEAFTTDAPDAKLQRSLLAEMSLLVEAFYGAPYVNWQARMKQVLFHYGRFASPAVYGPLQTVTDADWQRMLPLLEQAGLSEATLYSR